MQCGGGVTHANGMLDAEEPGELTFKLLDLRAHRQPLALQNTLNSRELFVTVVQIS
jgi:hypothetical protein